MTDDGRVFPKCARCGVVYNRARNIGTLGCRYHPAEPDDTADGVRACCGLRAMTWVRRMTTRPTPPPTYADEARLGCTRCDHDYDAARHGITVLWRGSASAAHVSDEAVAVRDPAWAKLVELVADRLAAAAPPSPPSPEKVAGIVAHIATKLWADVPPDAPDRDAALHSLSAAVRSVTHATRTAILAGTPEGNQRLIEARLLPPALVVRRASLTPESTVLLHVATVNDLRAH